MSSLPTFADGDFTEQMIPTSFLTTTSAERKECRWSFRVGTVKPTNENFKLHPTLSSRGRFQFPEAREAHVQ